MSDKFIFGRISLAQLKQAQEELLRYISDNRVKNIDPIKFINLYNKATLGLTWDLDRAVRKMIFFNKLEKRILLRILPIIFSKALRRALAYRAEVDRLREVKTVDIG